MGSQYSSSNSLNKRLNSKNKKTNSEIYQDNSTNFNDSSSYKGIHTETTSINGNSLSGNSSQSDKNNENTNEQPNDIKIPTLFQWKEGGNNILITGSFCGWSHRFAMLKNEKNNYYELKLFLPKGEYQFKFIVDNIWRCSNFYSTVTDQNNNTNNILDNTKELNEIIKEREKEKEKERENQKTANTSTNYDNDKKKNYQNATMNLSEKMKKNYGNLFPMKEQLNSEPPHLPQHYINPVNLNCYPDVGKKKYIYNRLKNNLIRETFKAVEKKYIRNSISFRVRSKFATIIYFHPNQEDFI